MRVELRLFAVARQRTGLASIGLDLPDGATVADLRRALIAARPDLAPLVPSLLFAVDSEYADDDHPIPPGSELAAIPPVSGGSSPTEQHPR